MQQWGLSLYHVSNYILQQNQFINPKNLKSQNYLNFKNYYKFTTRLELTSEHIETVTEARLLGAVLTNDLLWERNTEELVKKAYARMKM